LGWLWNAGMFMFGSGAMLAEAEAHAPDCLSGAQKAVRDAVRIGDVVKLDASAFAGCPSSPFDIAIMEKTRNGAVVPVAPAWSDVGSWSALWEIAEKSEDGNAGPGLFIDTQDCLVRSDGPHVSLLGVKDLIVVVSDGAVLILPREQSQRVRDVVERLKKGDRSDLL